MAKKNRYKKRLRHPDENCPYRNFNNDDLKIINISEDDEDLDAENEELELWEGIYGDDPLLNDEKEDEKKIQKDEKVKSFIDKILNWGDKSASIISKFKNGATMYDSGDKYEIYPEDKNNKDADKMMRNWIIGIITIVIISVIILILTGRKNKKKQ